MGASTCLWQGGTNAWFESVWYLSQVAWCDRNKHVKLFKFEILKSGSIHELTRINMLSFLNLNNICEDNWTPRNLMFLLHFSNKEPNTNTLSKDRWTVLKISKDLTELTDIGGGNLSKKKGKRLDSGCDEFSND